MLFYSIKMKTKLTQPFLLTGLRKTLHLWVVSHTTVLSRRIFWWSREAVLVPRRGLLLCASPFLSRLLVLLLRISNSSLSIPLPSLDMVVSRQHQRSKSSMDASKLNYGSSFEMLGTCFSCFVTICFKLCTVSIWHFNNSILGLF